MAFSPDSVRGHLACATLAHCEFHSAIFAAAAGSSAEPKVLAAQYKVTGAAILFCL
jgi:hypothetical protein